MQAKARDDSTTPKQKMQRLAGILAGIPSCVIALSGGMDSAFLCWAASEHVPGRVICATVVDPTLPARDRESALSFCREMGLEHVLMESSIPDTVRKNPPDRCYHCKRHVFGLMEEIRARENLACILDGENASDAEDARPGRAAARELGVRSPLAEAGLRKEDIRHLAALAGLEAIIKPQSACLSSRFPAGMPLEDTLLARVDATEELIRSMGFEMVRARVEDGGVRIELGQEENTPENRARLESLAGEIAALGWGSVSVDPTGYVPAGLRRPEK